MFFLRRPDDEAVRRFHDEQSGLPFTYDEVGATRDRAAPAGFPLNHHRVLLGRGSETYNRGRDAIRRWAMYDLDWTRLFPADAPQVPGVTVVVLVRHVAFWSLNAARIIYALDEDDGSIRRAGFAFGTLPGHAEQGEERFTVEYRHHDQSVWYEIYTYARGQHPLVRLSYPIMRLVQKRFGRQSTSAMQAAVNTSGDGGRDG